MKIFKNRLNRLVVLCILSVLLHGCSTLWGPKPDIVSEEKQPGHTYSSAETRRILIDQPNLLSGDYFRERSEKETPASIIGTDDDLVSRSEYARSEALPAEWPRKIGLLFETPEISGHIAEVLLREAARALPQGVVMIDPYRLREVLASADCKTDMDCVSGQVALYPGVRILVVAEALRLPESYPGKAEIRFRLIDVDLKYTYPMVELTATLEDTSTVDAFFFQACRRVFTDASRYADVMPPHARVFSVKGDRIYISAGKLSGVAPGAVFPVVSGGETVDAPSGVPVGWVPGDSKGVVRVETLVGDDASGCSLIEGKMPVMGDYVMFKKTKK